VAFENVHFAYEGHAPILRDFSLHLKPGETVALVGRTGSGKSTVARLIPRFYDITDGAVRVDGHDVRDVSQRSLRSHIGLVLDDPFLFSESVFDNIAFGRPDASIDEVVEAATAAGAHDFVCALGDGYESIIGERGYTLSGGQRQRLSIARTLLVNPRILILDDATSSIDAQREFEIHEALKTLMRGRTTLIIAHRLSTIGLADRVAVMEDGRVIAEGTHDELINTVPAYAEILAHAAEDDIRHAEEIEAEDERRHADAEAAARVGRTDQVEVGGGD
jgi:ATP-binding cassette subfamily B protein